MCWQVSPPLNETGKSRIAGATLAGDIIEQIFCFYKLFMSATKTDPMGVPDAVDRQGDTPIYAGYRLVINLAGGVLEKGFGLLYSLIVDKIIR